MLDKTIEDYVVEVIRKAIKNIYLRVNPRKKQVRLTAPLRMEEETVQSIMTLKLPWVRKQIEKFKNQKFQAKKRFISGENHYFRGSYYILNVIYHSAAPKVVLRNNTHIDLHVRNGSKLAQRKYVLSEWYRRDLKERIPTYLAKWQPIIGVELNAWSIRQMKTKWGVCHTSSKKILLNLELAKKPDHCLEYVIVHELVHLLERSHNKRFVAFMDQFLPTWRSWKEELNQVC